MSRLLVVRHGQASIGTDDYDRLSPRGHAQSERLGRWLAQAGVRPAHVVCGAMRRHRQTLEGIASGFGQALPEADIDAGLNEFDHTAVLRCFVEANPDHPATPIAGALWDAEPREVAALLRAALGAWVRCELDALVPERWEAFRARVQASAQRWSRHAGDVLVVTSGGVKSQLAQAALGVPDERALDLNLGIRNSAVSEFVPRDGRIGLLSWNTLPHLADAPELWTHF